MKDEHECCIGQWYEYESSELITFKELKDKIKNHNSTYSYALNNFGKDFVKDFIEEIKIENYFDNRKNTNLIKFSYCPFCGKQINWKEMKKSIN